MSNIGFATLSVIPSTRGFAAALSAKTTPAMAAAGRTGGIAFGKAALAGITVAAAAVAVAGVAGLKMASDFQASTTLLVTGAGEAEGALGAVRQGILGMAGSVGTTPQDLSSGMYLIESAGYRGAEGLSVLKAAAEGAKVGAADMATVADGLTTAMTDYQFPASQAAEVTSKLVTTVGAGKTTMDQLSGSLAQVLPFASSLKIGFNDVMGAMATMTGQGIPAAEAATYLKFTMMSLANETPQGVAALESVGMSTQQLTDDLKNKGLSGTLAEITDTIGKKFPQGSAEYNRALAAIVGGTRGMGATLALTGGNAQTFADNIEKIGGATTEAGGHVKGFAFEEATLASKMDTAKASVSAMAIKMGNHLLPAAMSVADFFNNSVMPALTDLGVFITGTVIPAVQGFVDEFKNGEGAGGTFRDVLTGVRDAIVKVADYITGTAIPAVKDFGKWIGEAKTPILSVAGVITAIFLPAIVRAGVLSTISAAKQVAAWVVMGAQAIISGAETVAIWVLIQASAIRATVVSVAQFVIQGAKWVWSGAVAVFNAAIHVGAWVAVGAGAIAATVVSIAQFVVQGAKWVWMGVMAMANAAVIAAAWLISMGPIGLVIAAVVGLGILIALNMDRIKGWISAAWEWIKTTTSTAWNAIATFFSGLWTSITSTLTTAWDAIVGFFSAIPGRVGAFFNMVKNKVVEVFGYTPMGLIVNNWDAIVGFFTGLPAKIGTAVAGMWDGITGSFKDALNTVIRWWNNFSLDLKIPSNSVTDFLHLSGAGFTVRTPNIPLLASGALVTNPALAVLGESGSEAVLPFSRVDEFAAMVARQMGQMDAGPVSGRGRDLIDYDRLAAAMSNVNLTMDGRRVSQSADAWIGASIR